MSNVYRSWAALRSAPGAGEALVAQGDELSGGTSEQHAPTDGSSEGHQSDLSVLQVCAVLMVAAAVLRFTDDPRRK